MARPGLPSVAAAITVAWSRVAVTWSRTGATVPIAWSRVAIAPVAAGARGSLWAPTRRGGLCATGQPVAPELLVASLSRLGFAPLLLLPVPVVAALEGPRRRASAPRRARKPMGEAWRLLPGSWRVQEARPTG